MYGARTIRLDAFHFGLDLVHGETDKPASDILGGAFFREFVVGPSQGCIYYVVEFEVVGRQVAARFDVIEHTVPDLAEFRQVRFHELEEPLRILAGGFRCRPSHLSPDPPPPFDPLPPLSP